MRSNARSITSTSGSSGTWSKALPVAEEVIGDDERSKVDIARPLALINDFFDAGEGALGEALRPMYVDYLEEHADD